jgi:pimeloyl-ACP methyl ester carboxylesterase
MCCSFRCLKVWVSLAVIVFAVVSRSAHEQINGEHQLPKLQPKTFGLPLRPGVKVMVMLSGWPDTHSVWEKQILHMQDDYHIISIVSPDLDQPRLKKPWGYRFDEVPKMIDACVELHLGKRRKIDVLLTHDWGALYGYYVLQKWSELGQRKVGYLVAIDIGASDRDDARDPAFIPGVTQATLYSVPYQIFLGTLFAVGSGVSETVAEFIAANGWPLMPLLTPMESTFDWKTEAVRPQNEVKWWFGYSYFYLWLGRVGLGPAVPTPLFPSVPTLFVYGLKKRTMFHSDAFIKRLNATPRYRVVEYPNSSHWLMFTDASPFNKDLAEFVSST